MDFKTKINLFYEVIEVGHHIRYRLVHKGMDNLIPIQYDDVYSFDNCFNLTII